MDRGRISCLLILVMTIALLFGPGISPAKADTLFSLSAPGSLTVDPAITAVTLQWLDNSSWESGYNIERKGPGESSFSQVGVVGSNVTTYTNTGLTAGTQYTYRVYAFNDWDATPSYSNTVTVETNSISIVVPIIPLLTFPAAPSDLSADPQFVTINLSWIDNSNNESSFIIERLDPGSSSYVEVGTVGANVVEYTDDGLTMDTQYLYRVKAHNSIGDSNFSNIVTVKTAKVDILLPLLTYPATPGNLAADSIFASNVVLKWSDNSNNESGFKLERSISGSSYSEIATIPANQESYTDTAVEPGSSCSYRIRAYNSFGNSSYSNTLTVIIPPATTTATTTLIYTIDSPSYMWNGVPQAMDVAPIIRESRTLLPIRYVADPLGAQTMWNSVERKVTIVTASKTIELWVDNNTARINGVAVLIDPANPNVMPIVIPPGRTMMPLAFIANTLDCDVVWNSVERKVTVTFPKS